jgi:2,5-furandicarboxylate decarboxylase 1
MRLDGRAGVYFKSVNGHVMPVVANTLFNRDIMAQALSVPVERRVNRFFEAVSSPLPCITVYKKNLYLMEGIKADAIRNFKKAFKPVLHLA